MTPERVILALGLVALLMLGIGRRLRRVSKEQTTRIDER